MEPDRTVGFYEKLGFALVRNDQAERVLVLKHSSGIELNLLLTGNDDYDGKNVLMDTATRYPGYTHFAIEVGSIEDAKEFLMSHGVPITEGPVTFGDGKISIFVRDPDRNVIEFTELPTA